MSTVSDRGAPDAVSGVLSRRWLARELVRLRDAADLTQRDTARAVGWSTSKLLRIENARVPISPTDTAALANLYGVTDSGRIAELRAAAVSGRAQPWHRFRDVLNPGMRGYLGLEQAATVIRMFRHGVVPELLQTVDYAREVTAALVLPGWSAERVRRRTRVALARQALLERPDPPAVVVLLDQAVVGRLTADDPVKRTQLAHVRRLAARPRVSIRYVPYEFGVHRGHEAEFTVLEFAGGEPPVVFRHASLNHAETHPDGAGEFVRLFTVLESAARDLSTFRAVDAPTVAAHRLVSAARAVGR